MIENNVEGVDVFQRVTVVDGGQFEGKQVWKVVEDALIIDGMVKFYSHKLDCYFELNVKQVKGRGTADADKLTKLSPTHKQILLLVVKQQVDELTAKEIKDLVIEETPNADPNHLNRPISELRRKGCFTPDGKLLKLNKFVIEKCLETGLFI